MQKIVPCLWFNYTGKEAAELYINAFGKGKVKEVQIYPENTPGIEGKDMLVIFELFGKEIMALNGGPEFKHNPSASLFVNLNSVERVDEVYKKLSEEGNVLMELNEYDFSKRYAWINDRFGVSWQLSYSEGEESITPSLLFTQAQNGRVQEAIELYTNTFPNSKVNTISKYQDGEADTAGNIKYSNITLEGEDLILMESGLEHNFNFSEAFSFIINTDGQEETDKYWNKLIADGGEESVCGWLKDKFGVSWQVTPVQLNELMSKGTKEQSNRVMQAMLGMKKIVVSELEAAYKG